nr:hypothetical protein BaRGS_032068 [Batillaria attramentaria]
MVHPADLAHTGFVHTGPQDRVQCVFCEGSLRNWHAGDVPSLEHQRHFPACIMARSSQPGTPNLGYLRADRRRTSSPLLVPSGSGVHTIADSPSPTDAAREVTPTGIVTERPKHGGMAIEAARIASYRNWPPGKTQTPQQLAKAGFFYAGFNDSVKCFFCDGGLRNWEREDDPWHEHARWFPRCKYVRQVKGDHFVEQVLAEEGGKVPQSATYEENCWRVAGDQEGNLRVVERERTRSGSTGQEPAENRRVVEPREVTARMDSPVVQAVLNMDIPQELVRRAIEQRLRNTGDDFPSMEALLEVVFALPAGYHGENRSGNQGAETGVGQPVPGEMRVGPEEAPRSLIEENRQLKEQRTCKICMDEEVTAKVEDTHDQLSYDL